MAAKEVWSKNGLQTLYPNHPVSQQIPSRLDLDLPSPKLNLASDYIVANKTRVHCDIILQWYCTRHLTLH